eukprot:TRINITY_DN4674_c0_g2_i1.p1 TRINITY_DN4674_c0_g2~~TRINITY_DN4674_c0_g2_i1.p1  ORF type:complete len:2877 (+),score=580.25 TRINITY_DN4674_c0_g2_i1:257-8887(+)
MSAGVSEAAGSMAVAWKRRRRRTLAAPSAASHALEVPEHRAYGSGRLGRDGAAAAAPCGRWLRPSQRWCSFGSRRHFGGSIFGLLVCMARLAADVVQADINFTRFIRDPSGVGRNQHLRLMGGAMVDYFSTEFNELCPEGHSAGAVPEPIGITQRFQHPQRRNISDFEDLPIYTYLDDAQLDNPRAGEISNGLYTQVVNTKEFIVDGDLLPLPHNRTQMCHYAIRLTPPEPTMNTAVWSRFKQNIMYGFETEFHFRILHPSKECFAAGMNSEWCVDAGADGFAFVIQNNDRKSVGSEVNGLGYGFKKSIAVEFDTYRNLEFDGRARKNHVSVHVPPNPDMPNSGLHEGYEVAYSDDIPPLLEGTHVVRISYDVKHHKWDSMFKSFESDLPYERLRKDSMARPGIFKVEFDGQEIISIPLDLFTIVKPESTESIQADPPVPPNISGYDEGGNMPGRAWIGFTSSTSYSQWQCVDILSWTFKEQVNCPGPNPDDPAIPDNANVTCRLDEGILDRRPGCSQDGKGGLNPFCAFVVQNAARQPIMFTASYRFDKPFLPTHCTNGFLQWDHLHPYFLGCERTVYWTHDMDELWIHTTDNVRKVVLGDQTTLNKHILQKDPIPFKRRSLFKYCVTEHANDPSLLYFAECNCQYCVRQLDNSASYAMFYQHVCTERYGLLCPCYEVSEVAHDASAWSQLEPMKFMRLHTCRGCVYSSQCSMMLKVAVCEDAYQPYFVGNPLTPTILDNGFQDLLRDQGRVTDGQIRGDACNCEPRLRPYRGDASGASGMCAEANELNRFEVKDVNMCAAKCEGTANCQFFTTWTDGRCRVYRACAWIVCASFPTVKLVDECFSSTTWRLADLGSYTTTRGYPQLFPVYPKRTVQKDPMSCFQCLHNYEDEFCKAMCGRALNITYLHWPHGQKCSSCMFAGNRMHEMTGLQNQAVKHCVSEAIRTGQDPWVVCDETAVIESGARAIDLFNGVATHFLTECPGRSFKEGGAVCAPNIHAMHHFDGKQILARLSSINNTVWSNGMECLNALCEIVPRRTCYERLLVYHITRLEDYNTKIYERYNRLNGTVLNDPRVRNLDGNTVLNLTKSFNQYVVTEPIPFYLENITIETWVEVGEIERVKDVARGAPMLADTYWKEDYYSEFAVDGQMATYWSSQLGAFGDMRMDVEWRLDMNESRYAGYIHIYWKEPAEDYVVYGSNDNESWEVLVDVLGNKAKTSYHQRFFQARYIWLHITRAAEVMVLGPGDGLPVVSIREFEVLIDNNVARLKNTNASFRYHRPSRYVQDNDNTTWWSSLPGEDTARLVLDLGAWTQKIQIIQVEWAVKPEKYGIYFNAEPCNGTQMPGEDAYIKLSGAGVENKTTINEFWNGQCIGIDIEIIKPYYGVKLAGLAELQVYAEAENLAGPPVPQEDFPAYVFATWPPLPTISAEENATWKNWVNPFHLTDVRNATDANPGTFWFVQPTDGTVTLTIDLGQPRLVMSVTVRWGTVDGVAYKASTFAIDGGENAYPLKEYDLVSNSFAAEHRTVIFENIRFLRLRVLRVFSTNPRGRLAIEDFIISAASDNLAARPAAVTTVTSAWIEPDEYPRYAHDLDGNMVDTVPASTWETFDGDLRIHDGHFAVDDDFSTYFATPYLYDTSGMSYLEVHLDGPQGINLIVIRWRYPAKELTAWCQRGGRDSQIVASVLDNDKWISPVQLIGRQTCEKVKLIFGLPLQTFAGRDVIGVREMQLYDYSVNYALAKPVNASDGTDASLAVDFDTSTKWDTASDAPTNITIDLLTNYTAWGVRVLFSSGRVAKEMTILASLDNVNWQLLGYYSDNSERDVFAVPPEYFSCRYIIVMLQTVQQTSFAFNFYGLRAVQVLGSPNLALNRPVSAPVGWNHSGFESVDGDNETFFASEPLSTEVRLTVDLEEETYIGGGIFLEFVEGFEAEDFDIWTGDNDSDMKFLEGVVGNNMTEVTFLKHFDDRFVELRMYRPSPVNGAGMFLLKSFDILFDPNLAHGKIASATHTAEPSRFVEKYSIDEEMSTIWMPEQATDSSRIVFELGVDRLFSGFDVTWRRPPVSFSMEVWTPAGQWREVIRYEPERFAPDVGFFQKFVEGFSGSMLAIQIHDVYESPEGRIVALREVLVRYPHWTNYALNAPTAVCDGCSQLAGTLSPNAVDGNYRGTYWQPSYNHATAWIEVTLPDVPHDNFPTWGMLVGRVTIWWRYTPDHWKIEFTTDYKFITWQTVKTGNGRILPNEDDQMMTDFAFLRYAKKMRLTIIDTFGDPIGVHQISVFAHYAEVPPKVDNVTYAKWEVAAEDAIDLSNQTYWMAPPDTMFVEFLVDLKKVYLAYDIYIWWGFSPDRFDLYISTDNVTWEQRDVISEGAIRGRVHLRNIGFEFPCRFIRIDILRPFKDDEGYWSTSIRDIAVYRFTNLARYQLASHNSIWEYPVAAVTDGDENTWWTSKFDVEEAVLDIDLGEPKNIAGMKIVFLHGALNFKVRHSNNFSLNASLWPTAYVVYGFSRDPPVMEWDTHTTHFKAQYLRLEMTEPLEDIYHPEVRGGEGSRPVFSVKEWSILEHPGGGGTVGLQNLDGSEFMTLTYGLRQPGEWLMSSENDIFTKDLYGGVYDEDIGTRAHFVMTFQKVKEAAGVRTTRIAVFRNGVPYGEPYEMSAPADRLRQPNTTRMVIGVRSSAHYDSGRGLPFDPTNMTPDVTQNVIHGDTHNPFFEGGVYNMTLIKNALTPEEVRGLYEAVTTEDGQELGCHCYDACPTGFNRFFPTVPVPCSGQGVCVRDKIIEFNGHCICTQGFSGDNCEDHCSVNSSRLTTWGCCQDHDDCPNYTHCNAESYACIEGLPPPPPPPPNITIVEDDETGTRRLVTLTEDEAAEAGVEPSTLLYS